MRNSLLIILFIVSQQAWSQTDELNVLVKSWQGSVSEVTTASKTFKQEILSPAPASIRYNFTEVDQKGGMTSFASEFNLADLDPYAVRSETQKDIIWVVLSVRNKQKLAKMYKNNEVQAYDETVRIHARNIDNAREMVDIVKKAIPLAERIVTNRLKLTDYNEMVAWIIANVKDVSLGTKSVNQRLAKGDYIGSLRLVSIQSDGKSSHEEDFEFNLADINPNAITFKIHGNQFALNLEMTQRLKTVFLKKDGENKPFQNEIDIETNNVDEARDLKTVLSLVVPLAISKVNADMPPINSESDGLKFLSGQLKDIKLGTKLITQAIGPKCLTTYTQVTQDPGSSEKGVYDFNWMDLNPNAYRIEVAGEKMYIDVATAEKKKVIKYTKNEKLDGFNSEARFYAENMESARRMKYAMDKVVDYCKKSYHEPFQGDLKSTVSYLQKTVGEVSMEGLSIKQVLEPLGEGNKIKLTKITVKGNAGSEEIYEFNLSDISPTSVTYGMEGKTLLVEFESNFKNKIFNYYKDGKIQPYVFKIDLAMPEAETARNVINALRSSVENVKK